ncbi:hypothetical protein [Hyphomicrobium sp. D-2]|nr:hypothetical protein [Hyphomicrobium sp. D-2]MDH4982991.1 hypothetical protein [Hyphomicrobium sp. D-2]
MERFISFLKRSFWILFVAFGWVTVGQDGRDCARLLREVAAARAH